MFYTIYVTTNKIDGKWYLGMHQTKNLNDGYMGSGKYLKRAIEKHGIENFEKEILCLCESEQEMRDFEAGIINKEFLKEQEDLGTTYNLLEGGKGGFGYLNKNKLNGKILITNKEHAKEMGKKGGLITQKKYKENNNDNHPFLKYNYRSKRFLGKKHTKESKEKIGLANKKLIGIKNKQYGTFWITNGVENKKTKCDIPEGWYKGRKIGRGY
jgi:hypothetical protein